MTLSLFYVGFKTSFKTFKILSGKIVFVSVVWNKEGIFHEIITFPSSIAQRAQGETKATTQTEGHEERLGPRVRINLKL